MEITEGIYNLKYKGRTFNVSDTGFTTYKMGDIEINMDGLNEVRVYRVDPYQDTYVSSVELNYVIEYINSKFWIVKDKGIKLLQ